MFKNAALSILLTCLLGSIASADEAGKDARPINPLVQSDPRHPDGGGVALRFIRGAKPEKGDHGAYVIVAWANPPAGKDVRGYQFWGDDRIVGKKTIEFVLETVLKERPRDVFVLGNEWAAGSELDPLLEELSKRLQIDVIGGSTFKFNKVDLREEPEDVKNLISKAINLAQKAEQAAPLKGGKPTN